MNIINIAYSPSVIYDPNDSNAPYKMWYILCSNGFYKKVEYATSKDGINWIKYGTVLNIGKGLKDFDSNDIYCPSVIYDPDDSKNPYKMWYSGDDKLNWRIGYATSIDGKQWTKQGMVLDIGSPGDFDSICAYNSLVIYNPSDSKSPYKMWYMGFDMRYDKVGYATSKDGKHWIKHGVISNPENPKYFNNCNIYGLSVIYNLSRPNSLRKPYAFEMLYLKFEYLDSRRIIGYATSSNGKSWVEKEIVGDPFDIHTPSIIYDPGTNAPYKMWYSGHDKSYQNWALKYTESKNGINWNKPVAISMK